MPSTEPVDAEFTAAATWLAKHGFRVAEPTPLLALRLGVRGGARPPGYWNVLPGLLVAVFVGLFAVQFLPLLLGVDRYLAEGRISMVLFTVIFVGNWLPVRRADRRAAVWLGDRRPDRPRPPWREVLGGWYLASAAITFGGGVVLAAVMAVTTSRWAWPLSWLGQLVVGAAVVAFIWPAWSGGRSSPKTKARSRSTPPPGSPTPVSRPRRCSRCRCSSTW
ncbi:hypothetical protein OG738_17425 [Amycolatopsis sp. NBC_01488]|uniref:hypothetical protein n=1 Tax=Amycolatopsis sp. NBC_01488 TaxID=2903563 RepID=UPI002E27C915|nr:hypothetical protein [Amycolatopsis sp. NBC_01488]